MLDHDPGLGPAPPIRPPCNILLRVKIGVLSDIHCNVANMRRAMAEMSRIVDEVIVAGDAVYEYRFSTEVVRIIRQGKFPYVLGNHEKSLLGPHGQRARSRPDVTEGELRFMSERPSRLDLKIGGRTLTLVHASPWHPYDSYLGPDDPLWQRCTDLNTDFVVTGHTHLPSVRRVASTTVVNPGSIGESHEPEGGGSYAIIDLSSAEVQIFRIETAAVRFRSDGSAPPLIAPIVP